MVKVDEMEILKCPKCGEAHLNSEKEITVINGKRQTSSKFWVSCDCKSFLPFVSSLAQHKRRRNAIEGWNKKVEREKREIKHNKEYMTVEIKKKDFSSFLEWQKQIGENSISLLQAIRYREALKE